MLQARRSDIISIVLAIPAIVYIVLRAVWLDFTYDECWTYLGYATSDLWFVLTNEYPAANNHILHSVLMMLFDSIFGTKEWALRLPVLIAFLGFVYFSIQITRKLDPVLRISWLILLLYQPYVLDYFVAARGYGLSMTFMLGMLFHLKSYAETSARRHVPFALLFGVLAAWSNFTYLLILISGIGGVVFIAYHQKQLRSVLTPCLVAISTAILLFSLPIKRLMLAKEFYYGGQEGFFQDTLGSLAYSILYHQNDGDMLSLVLVVLLIAIAANTIFNGIKTKIDSVGYWAGWILICSLFGSICQHLLLGSPFLTDRTAIFVIPLLTIAMLPLILMVSNQLLRNSIGVFVAIVSVINLGFATNYTHLIDFKEYADASKAMKWIDENREAFNEDEFKVGKSVYMNASLNFYRIKYDVQGMQVSGLEDCDTERYPVYYLFENSLSCIEAIPVDTIEFYPVSNTYLMKPKK